MRTPLSFTVSIHAALAFLVLLACRADQTNLFPQVRFVPVDVRVVDSTTTLPVVGAIVRPECMGGTPYATNSCRTDTNGVARITSFERLTAVRVTMSGYEEASQAFLPTNGVLTNAVVRLKRVRK